MRRILVTAISGNVSNGILKALQDAKDEVYGCDIYDYPVGMDKVKAYWKSEPAISPTYVESLLEKIREHHITHLIPANEQEIRVVDEHRSLFEESNIRLIMNRSSILANFLDKKKTCDYLEEIGVSVPATYTLEDFKEDGREYVVKFRNSCGSKLLQRVRTRKEVLALHLADPFVIQEYLPQEADEYTVGVFSDGSSVDSICFRRKLEHGYTSFVELQENREIEEIAGKIAREIGLRGCMNIQLRKDGQEYKIFEINPRISGTVYFRHLLGFQDVLWWLDLVDGLPHSPYRAKYKKAVGMRELAEKFVILE